MPLPDGGPTPDLATALSDRYRIERELGRGGMATVYLAHDLRHHRQVAVKVLHSEVADAVGAERFLREIEVTAQLDHPHIMALLDSGSAAGFLYYVMPYVEGESLRARLTRERQLPLDAALHIARQVADALSYAHSRGVVHRDVKPENILLAAGHARVADFGIARALSHVGNARLTETGLAVGTPSYMSPEQAAGGQDLDGRSDLYSLACVLYEMLAGQPPFTGPTAASVIHQHLVAQPPDVAVLRPAVPSLVADALVRALSKSAADRFNPVGQFAVALGQDTGAAPRPSANPARGPVARWAAVGALACVVAAAGWFGLGRPRRAATSFPRTTIAVLPFDDAGIDTAHAYLAGGLHEELLTQLAKARALTVISRRSVLGYRGTAKSAREIAHELSAGALVEGSIQVVGNRLRVNVQLIDAATDAHLWAERYDRALDDAFAIESEIARQVTAAVGAVLSTEQTERLARVPTQNAEAYRWYLRAREYYSRGLGDPSIGLAAQMFDSAVVRDPEFAVAWAELAKAHARAYFQLNDRSPTRAASARHAVEQVTRLAAGSPEAHEARAWYAYWVEGTYATAAAEFSEAIARGAKNADVQLGSGMSMRRLGRWDDALAALLQAQAMDPRSSEIAVEVGISELAARRYPSAISAFRQAVALAPDQHRPYGYLAAALIARDQTLDSARLVLRQAGRVVGDAAFVSRSFDGKAVTSITWMLPELFPETFARVSRQELGLRRVAFFLCLADWHWRHGRPDLQRAYGDSVLASRLRSARALALVGNRTEARRVARVELDSLQQHDDHRSLPQGLYEMARTYAVLGDGAEALTLLERVASMPSELSVGMIMHDPTFAALRSDPRFSAITAVPSR